MLIDKVKNVVNNYIIENDITNIVSIYGIGSFAKRKEIVNDIDLNIFLDNCDYNSIMEIEKMKHYLIKKLQKDIDFNIIEMELVYDDLLSSPIFPHKNRHSLFLYELVQLDCLVYGKNILENLQFEKKDLKQECVKLTLTLVQRLNKEILTKKTNETDKNGRKFARYALEFTLINRGIQNPYFLTSKEIETVLYYIPEISYCTSLVSDILDSSTVDLQDSYNLVRDLSLILKDNYLLTEA